MRLLRTLTLWTVATLCGCTTTYDPYYVFDPKPAPLQIASAPASESQPVHVLVSVIGVRTPRAKEHPHSIEAALRIDNRSPQPVRLDAASFELILADLQSVRPAQPQAVFTAAPGEKTQFTLYFPLPMERKRIAPALMGLTLRWTMRVGDQSLSRSVCLTRRSLPPPAMYYPYDPWRYHYFDAHFHHHHHNP